MKTSNTIGYMKTTCHVPTMTGKRMTMYKVNVQPETIVARTVLLSNTASSGRSSIEPLLFLTSAPEKVAMRPVFFSHLNH